MSSRQACSIHRRIPQATVLANLPDDGSNRLETDPTTGEQRVVRQNVLKTMDRSKWAVTAFDPSNRSVCITVNSKVPVYVSVTLPYMTSNAFKS